MKQILEKSQNLCKEDHYTKAIDLKWSEKKSNDEIFAEMIVTYKFFLPQTFTSHVMFNSKKLQIFTV